MCIDLHVLNVFFVKFFLMFISVPCVMFLSLSILYFEYDFNNKYII